MGVELLDQVPPKEGGGGIYNFNGDIMAIDLMRHMQNGILLDKKRVTEWQTED